MKAGIEAAPLLQGARTEPPSPNVRQFAGFVLTRRFFVLLSLGLLPLTLSWLDGRVVWLTAAYNGVLLGAAGLDLKRCEGAREVRLHRVFDPPVCLGFQNRVRIEISNSAPRRVRVLILDEVPPESVAIPGPVEAWVDPGGMAAAEYIFRPVRRGRMRFMNINARIEGRLRLVRREICTRTPEEIRVYPDLRGARQIDLALRAGRPGLSGLRKLRFRGQGREFESLRDFVAGDCLRHVAWSASARRAKLVIKEFQAERNQTIVIMIDSGRMMTARVGDQTKMDHAVHAALGLMWAARAHGDRVGLITFCRNVERSVPPRSGSRHFARIMEILSEAQPQLVESDYRAAVKYVLASQRRRALVVLLTDIIDREGSKDLLSSFARLVPPHLPLLLAMRDADLDRVVRRPPRNAMDVYQQAVAESLQLERTVALGHFIRNGALAVDCPPAGATAQLIQHYLEIKERGLL